MVPFFFEKLPEERESRSQEGRGSRQAAGPRRLPLRGMLAFVPCVLTVRLQCNGVGVNSTRQEQEAGKSPGRPPLSNSLYALPARASPSSPPRGKGILPAGGRNLPRRSRRTIVQGAAGSAVCRITRREEQRLSETQHVSLCAGGRACGF